MKEIPNQDKKDLTGMEKYMISKGLKKIEIKTRPSLKSYMEKSGCNVDFTKGLKRNVETLRPILEPFENQSGNSNVSKLIRVNKKPCIKDASVIDLTKFELNPITPSTGYGAASKSPALDETSTFLSHQNLKRGPDLLGNRKVLPIKPKSNKGKRMESKPELSAEQKVILHAACQLNQSMFFTGRAGTGKSFLLREMIKVFKERSETSLAITASAGLAAYNIGGVTLHSFAGMGLGIGSADDNIAKVLANPVTLRRWNNTRILIIDEISMLNASFFDLLDQVAKAARNNSRPFGGLQMILWDFMQLPPVAENNEETKFVFETKAWADLNPKLFELNTIFRQKDQQFIKILNEMRNAQLSKESILLLQKRILQNSPENATNLFPLRTDVNRMNETELAKLKGQSFTFKANDWARYPADLKKLDAVIAPAVITLKVGARVMLIKNMHQLNLYNGCVGVVKSVDEKEQQVAVAFQEESGERIAVIERQSFELTKPHPANVYASRSQLPLILAYAMTIHKAQGQTLDKVHVDLEKIFEKGQAYVAVSRCTTLNGLSISSFNPQKVLAHPKVII